ncbi:MAG: hypothetical protein ABMA64_26885 [Myxococcota bacterium]
MNVLVTGFGPFPGVEVNPTETLVRALDGRHLGRARIVGAVLPVSYRRGPAMALAAARGCDAALVLGFGVATARDQVWVERRGRFVARGRPDVDHEEEPDLAPVPEVRATVDCEALARALGAGLSDDAGDYVCNAWLHRVAHGLAVPVGFVHVPSASIDVERAARAIEALVG